MSGIFFLFWRVHSLVNWRWADSIVMYLTKAFQINNFLALCIQLVVVEIEYLRGSVSVNARIISNSIPEKTTSRSFTCLTTVHRLHMVPQYITRASRCHTIDVRSHFPLLWDRACRHGRYIISAIPGSRKLVLLEFQTIGQDQHTELGICK